MCGLFSLHTDTFSCIAEVHRLKTDILSSVLGEILVAKKMVVCVMCTGKFLTRFISISPQAHKTLACPRNIILSLVKEVQKCLHCVHINTHCSSQFLQRLAYTNSSSPVHAYAGCLGFEYCIDTDNYNQTMNNWVKAILAWAYPHAARSLSA